MAKSRRGVEERYNAVQEMMFLLDNNMQNAFFIDSNNKKQSLGAPPPGLNNNNNDAFTTDLDINVWNRLDRGMVLDGSQLLELSFILQSLQDIHLWSKALSTYHTTTMSNNNNKKSNKKQQQDTTTKKIKFVELPKLGDCIQVNETLAELLKTAFDEEGRLDGTTFPNIGRLRAEIQLLKTDILQTLDDLVQTPEIQNALAMESGGSLYAQVNGRIVIPVSTLTSSKLGIVHDVSRSGKTSYVEPNAIVGPSNQLQRLQAELSTEEAEIWKLLSRAIQFNRPSLETSLAAVGQLDAIFAKITLGRDHLNGVIPNVQQDGIISLENAKHPVLVLKQKQRKEKNKGYQEVVGSDVELGTDDNRGLVLTGPNAGGKTVILKLLGLMALLTRNGIPIPASSNNKQPRVDFFHPILADIGDLQSVDGDLSTFSGHMLVCREVLAQTSKINNNKNDTALVLMDELGSGTDPSQGVAIAQAILEELINEEDDDGAGARVAITTHYGQLKQLAASDSRFAVAGMQFINGRPTYKLLQGTVGQSFALSVAERLQLPRRVLERARNLMDSETREMGNVLQDLEKQQEEWDMKREAMAIRESELDMMTAKMKAKEAAIEKDVLSARRDEANKFAAKLLEKEEVLKNVLKRIKENPSKRVIAKSWDEITLVRQEAIQEAEQTKAKKRKQKRKQQKLDRIVEKLTPLSELESIPLLRPGDYLQVVAPGFYYGQQMKIKYVNRKGVVLQEGPIESPRLKYHEVALPLPGTTQNEDEKTTAVVEVSYEVDGRVMTIRQESQTRQREKEREAARHFASLERNKKRPTAYNSINVAGHDMVEAKRIIYNRIHEALKEGEPNTLYVLHDDDNAEEEADEYGDYWKKDKQENVKHELRDWLQQETDLVKTAERGTRKEGGDSVTKVKLQWI